MRRHIIWPFLHMLKQGIAIRHQSLHAPAKIITNGRIHVLRYTKAGAGMSQKKVTNSQIHRRMRKQALDATGQLEKSATGGIKLNAMLLPHGTYFIVIQLLDMHVI